MEGEGEGERLDWLLERLVVAVVYRLLVEEERAGGWLVERVREEERGGTVLDLVAAGAQNDS
jgi:hypothetical protein